MYRLRAGRRAGWLRQQLQEEAGHRAATRPRRRCPLTQPGQHGQQRRRRSIPARQEHQRQQEDAQAGAGSRGSPSPTDAGSRLWPEWPARAAGTCVPGQPCSTAPGYVPQRGQTGGGSRRSSAPRSRKPSSSRPRNGNGSMPPASSRTWSTARRLNRQRTEQGSVASRASGSASRPT